MDIFQVLFYIFHAERIVDLAVFIQVFVQADSVLHDKQRQMIPVIVHVQHIPDTLGIDGPAPRLR